MSARATLAAYVYNGWHPCPERDAHFGPGWTEWELLKSAQPLFDGHRAPGLPRGGPYDDRDPAIWDARITIARCYGVDVFVPGWFWSLGKTVFDEPLLRGFLGADRCEDIRFAVFWANRMPHRVLPMRAIDAETPAEHRQVYTSPEDFVALIEFCAERFFTRPNYWRVAGKPYFSIFDTTLFLRQLGPLRAAEAVARAKDRVGGLHLVAVDPDVPWRPRLKDLGFDAVTHYVSLPIWKGGPRLQDYEERARCRESEWIDWPAATSLPYYPSVATGFDATPRGVWHPDEPPDRFPWAPIVVNTTPARFARHVAAGEEFTVARNGPQAPLFVASWNEWTEGHAIEPSAEHGEAYLAALGRAPRPNRVKNIC